MCKRIFSHQTQKEEEIPFYKIGTLGNDPDTFISKELFEEYKTKFSFPKKGEIMMTCSGTVGKCISFDGRDAYFQDSNIVWLDNPKLIVKNEFLYFILSNINWQKLNSTTITRIYGSDLKSLRVKFPMNHKEQDKTTDLLSLLDEKISTQSKIIEELTNFHESLSYNVFNQLIKFKNDLGFDYDNWKKIKLSTIGLTYNGLTGKTKDNFGKGKPYIQYKQIFYKSKINIEDFGLVDIADNEKQNKVRFGDVLFTTSSETPNEIATCSVLLDSVDDLYLNSFCFGFRLNQELFLPKFAQFLFRSSVFRKSVTPLAQGSTRYNISKNDFLKLEIKLPCVEEQQKIANTLSAIDKKIELETQYLEQLKRQKQYFMQNLFM